MPIMTAIRRIVVLPNHIRKFSSATSVRALHLWLKKEYACFRIPAWTSMALIGPPSANKVKNNIAKADAMIRFGR